MAVQIFHGDNQVASRQAFLSVKDHAKKAGKQLVELEGSKLSLPDLATAIETMSLLGSVNSVCIENFFARRPGNEKKAIVDYLKIHPESEIYLWEGKSQGLQLKSFSPVVVKKFDLPQHIFKFLDTFSITDLSLALTSTAPEQILALLAGQIHKLILVKDGVADLPSWQLAKLKSQSDKCTLEQLVSMNQRLLTIDYKQKTSALPYDLSAALELWVLSL